MSSCLHSRPRDSGNRHARRLPWQKKAMVTWFQNPLAGYAAFARQIGAKIIVKVRE